MIYYFENMKIRDIEKACKLNKELKEINEILKNIKFFKGIPLSSVLMLFLDNKRYDLNSLITQGAKTKIMNIIFDDCEERAKQIKQEIEEL